MAIKLLNEYPGDGKPTKREKDIFNRVLDRIKTNYPTMIELGCYNAYWSLVFRERFPYGMNILNDIDWDHLEVGRLNFKNNNFDCLISYGDADNCMDQLCPFTNGIEVLHMDIQGREIDVIRRWGDIPNNIVVATHSPEIHEQCKELLSDFDIWVDLPFGSIGGDGFLVGSK